jgi:hypothetical protein
VCRVALHELIVHGLVERLVGDCVHVLDGALAQTARGALAVQVSHIGWLQFGQLELADAFYDVIVDIALVAGPRARTQVCLLVGNAVPQERDHGQGVWRFDGLVVCQRMARIELFGLDVFAGLAVSGVSASVLLTHRGHFHRRRSARVARQISTTSGKFWRTRASGR